MHELIIFLFILWKNIYRNHTNMAGRKRSKSKRRSKSRSKSKKRSRSHAKKN
jgi:hypothetical protein